MPLLLHVVASGTLPAPHERGLRDLPLRLVEHGGVSGWATEWPIELDRALGREDLVRHHRVVELALAAAPSLPVRLPTWLNDESRLADLSERRAELAQALLRLDGKRELAVTAVWTADAAPPQEPAATDEGGAGRRYMEQRRREVAEVDARRAAAQQLARDIVNALGDDLLEALHTHAPSSTVVLSSALLVSAERVQHVVERLTTVRCAHENVRILVRGPWPPYSFTGLGEVTGT